MKTITMILLTILINACGSSKDATNNSNEDTTINTSKITQNKSVSLEYSAITRGTFQLIKVNSETITIQNARNEEVKTKKCSKEQWSKLVAMLEKIDLKAIPTLESPSKAHQYDGAAIGSFIVTLDDTSYRSMAFDAGNPNKKLKEIINEMLALSQAKE